MGGSSSRRTRDACGASTRRTGRAELVVDGVDTNRIAVARDGTLFLAGGSPTGGTLRRLEPGGKQTVLFDDLHVSDVAVLPDGDLIATASSRERSSASTLAPAPAGSSPGRARGAASRRPSRLTRLAAAQPP